MATLSSLSFLATARCRQLSATTTARMYSPRLPIPPIQFPIIAGQRQPPITPTLSLHALYITLKKTHLHLNPTEPTRNTTTNAGCAHSPHNTGLVTQSTAIAATCFPNGDPYHGSTAAGPLAKRPPSTRTTRQLSHLGAGTRDDDDDIDGDDVNSASLLAISSSEYSSAPPSARRDPLLLVFECSRPIKFAGPCCVVPEPSRCGG